MLCTEGILIHGALDAHSDNKIARIEFVSFPLQSFLEVFFSLLLVFGACYITNWVSKSTGKRQNTCLLTWHIINLLILTIVIALNAKLADTDKVYSLHEDDKDYWKY